MNVKEVNMKSGNLGKNLDLASNQLNAKQLKELLSKKLVEKVEYHKQVDMIYKKLAEKFKGTNQKFKERNSIEKTIQEFKKAEYD